MVRIGKTALERIDDHFRLTGPAEMLGNKAQRLVDPQSINLPALMRFPMQQPWPAYHPALLLTKNQEAWRKDVSFLLQTDALFQELKHSIAVERDFVRRFDDRRLNEVHQDKAFAEEWIVNEKLRQLRFFHQVLDITKQRTNDQRKIRALQLAVFAFLRENTVQRADTWQKETTAGIIKGQETRQKSLAWRQSNLYTTTEAGGFAKLKTRGHPLEQVTAQIENKHRHAVTTEHNAWREDNLYITLPNGGTIQAHNAAGGLHSERVHSDLHKPVLEDRRSTFHLWRGSNTQIELPNGGMIHAFSQGQQPEAAAAKLAQPRIDQRVDDHARFHASGQLQTLPNGGMISNADSGSAPEKVAASLYWPTREVISDAALEWHKSNLIAPTPNGGMAPLKDVGHAPERASAAHAQPLKDAATDAARTWHLEHRFGPTPNGGFAPLAGVGQSYEKTSADHAQPVKDLRTAGHHTWHMANLYAPTPNGGFAPLKNVGHSVEKTTSDFAKAAGNERTVAFDRWHDANTFVPMANGSIGQIDQVGLRPEKATADHRHVKAVDDTAGHLEARLDSLYAPTGNGSFRRLKGIGRRFEEVTAEVEQRREEDQSKTYRTKEPGELNTDAGQAAPLASTGRQLDEGKLDIAAQGKARLQPGLREIQRQLQAHTPQVSALHNHAEAPALPAGPEKPKKLS